MAPRPGYGIPLGRWYITNGSSGFRNRKINNSFHWRDITDDWKKFSRYVLRALRVLGGEGSGDDKKVNIKADENTRKYLAQYEASRPGTVHDTENNADKLKEKLKRKWLLKGERRWQHREETMATNREREAERDLDAREKQIRDREIMARKLAEWGDDIEADSGQEEYYKDSSEHTLEEERKQREEAMEAELNNKKEILTLATVGVSQNNSVKPKLTLNLTSKRRTALMALAEDEEFDDEEVKELVATIPTDKGEYS
ncbi:unnamed protein product [Rhizophagus irregularis]|nr:unnamed protein product [Rhizophagus irregularis]